MSIRDDTIFEVRIRPDIITEEFLATLRTHGVIEPYLFGSVSRGEERPDSDIDLLVTFAQPTSCFRQLDLKDELSRIAGRKVDLMTQIDPAFAPYITPTLVPISL